MIDIYYPKRDDILSWVSSNDDRWPSSDWDYYVLNDAENDSIVMELASDALCEKQEFFIHALYYFSGESYKLNREIDLIRVKKMIELVDNDSGELTKKWKVDIVKLLNGEVEFDNEYWLHHMF